MRIAETYLSGYSRSKITMVHRGLGFREVIVGIGYHAASSRRELNETFPSFVQQYLPQIWPSACRLDRESAGRYRDRQRKPAPNARSTVGTYTDIYSRLLVIRDIPLIP